MEFIETTGSTVNNTGNVSIFTALGSRVASNEIRLCRLISCIIETQQHSIYELPSRFGSFGGAYVPESLVDCLSQLERVYMDDGYPSRDI